MNNNKVTMSPAGHGKATLQWKHQRSSSEQKALESKIKDRHQQLMVSSFDIGKMLVELRDTFIPKGQWRTYLDAESQHTLGFSSRTAWRYLEGYEGATAGMPETKIKALQSKGLDPARPAVLAAAQKVVEIRGKKLGADAFAKEVQSQIKENMMRNVVPIDGKNRQHDRKPRRKTMLLEFCDRLFQDVDADTVKSDMNDVRDRIIAIKEKEVA